MVRQRGPTLSIRAFGPLACFTRPELKVERMSYPVMTPSAARGILEAILWKPAIRWRIEQIAVLAPIRFMAFRRNEVDTKASLPTESTVVSGGTPPVLLADEHRAQRNTVALRDVDYRIDATFELTDRAGDGDNVAKFTDMFRRRVEKGQHFHQPYFGCREFAANVLPATGNRQPIEDSRDLGIMLYDIDYGKKSNRPIFFRARLESGVLDVPDDPAATLLDLESGSGQGGQS